MSLEIPANLNRRNRAAAIFRYVCISTTVFVVCILATLIYNVAADGLPWLDAQFLDSYPSRFVEKAGIKSALYGTIWLISLTAMFAIPSYHGSRYLPVKLTTRYIPYNT